jgi:hypothetical protein
MICEEFSIILYVKRIDFINLLKKHKEDYEKFCFI